MTVAATIRSKLEDRFSPSEIEVIDESNLHAGHAGHRGRSETHFAVAMRSAAFAGRSRIERQRMVYEALSAELQAGVHALRLALAAPDDADQR